MVKSGRRGQPWAEGLLALARSLGLPRKRFMLLGFTTVFLLMYTFVNYSNANFPRLAFSISSDAAATTCATQLATGSTNPPQKDQLDGVGHKLKAPGKLHPIPELIKAGEAKWNAMLKSQSRTLSAAATEYKRRYGLPPPDGFDLWFKYALEHNVKLVDEYDEMMTALAPLRKLGSKEVRRRAENMLKYGFEEMGGLVVDGPHGELTFWDPEKEKKLQKRGGLVVVDGDPNGGYRTSGLLEMLEPVKGILKQKMKRWPKFAIPVNELAESRVVGGDDAKWRSLTDALVTRKDKYSPEDFWHEHRSGSRTLAEDFVLACGLESVYGKKAAGTRFEFGVQEVISLDGELKGEGRKADFLVDPNADNDICQRPELMAVHGVFRGTRLTTKGLYPMLSYGRPSAFSDIPIPSRYQWDEDGAYEYYASEDHPWEEKEAKIYWRGEPSGGGHGDKYYGSMHRHRLVALTNPKHFKTSVTMTGADAQGVYVEAVEPASVAQGFTNVTFCDIFSDQDNLCDMFGCDLQGVFPFEPRVNFPEAWRNKLVIDSDGWGPSGRWRALIASGSLAIRSSVYREWFGQLMVPWVHYVPASVGLSELWGILGYFLGGGDGMIAHDQEAKKIAEQGARWVEEHFRKEDMTIYCFRLILELNRLFNGDQWVYNA
ncbi:hypothetical protein FN846DRAFT_961516 [Sphaerosporella brunnea]|uniref:Glycosyl transferase CAP10 domain-containing protein n=1 Tax=Sphaerosporella brunnea TaxID=1250544 RepID=A0A5J5ENH0_9PEZI|nr:hypothetical protein FN846DRAFT_961516 [Sphaerosporella brunnea]